LTDDYDSETDSSVSDEAGDDDQEPLIIQLMESMFTRKKTVLETNSMINEISVENIRAELRALKIKEDV
jgi:hypothetical protein